MSRSIHTTRKTLSQIARKKFPSAEEKADALKEAGRALRRKRRIKRLVADERGRSAPPLAGDDPKTIPVEAHNAGRYVHHNASIDDLRAVLALLPAQATEGISSIKLILGKEYIDEEYGDEHEGRDPFVGRLSYETLPGVYSGVCLGTYSPGSGQIALHAHVYDPARLPLEQNICELYLRLRALKTFVHEVAHHHDDTNRVRRGRWLADRKENVEWYAEKMEHEWTRRIVLPYLEMTYPADVTALLDLVEHRGGSRLPLEFFAGDSRSTLRNGLIRFSFTTNGAFESWVRELAKCADLAASRLAFAWELHYADNYDECLQVLERVLFEKPDWNAALTCKGDTLVHLKRYDEAFVTAEKVLAAEPANGEAWEIRGDVFEARRDWSALLENCDRWLARVPEDSTSRFDAFQHRAVAYCALGDTQKMKTWIEAWANFGHRKRNSEFIRKAVFRRAGKELAKHALGSFVSLLLICAVNGAEEPLVLPIWPGAVPGDYGAIGPERVREPAEAPTKNAKWITNVTRPTVTVFRPVEDKNTGTAILICPGGGYWNLAWDLEGEEVAAWLNTVGVTGLVLKYRVPRRPGQPEPLPAPGPLLDAQRAVSLVRSRAADWGVERIGILGFSAGGHLAVATATHFDQRAYEPIDEIDKISCRPDFAVAVYPGYLIEQQPAGVEINKDVLAPYIRIPKETPPIFLVHASDDTMAGAENSVVMYLALKRANVATELHVYAQGGHGFGVRKSSLPCSTWTERCVAWLQNQGMLGTNAPADGNRAKKVP